MRADTLDPFDASTMSGVAGILADARPAELWALADIARGDSSLCVYSTTGRTCAAPRLTQAEGAKKTWEKFIRLGVGADKAGDG